MGAYCMRISGGILQIEPVAASGDASCEMPRYRGFRGCHCMNKPPLTFNVSPVM
jgi:hypothetical protein